MNQLFLICPECYIEQEIQKYFGDDCFFFTELGSVFGLCNLEFWNSIDCFIKREDIQNIYMVNDPSCTFIENIFHQNSQLTIDAERFLNNLKLSDVNIRSLLDLEEKKVRLCALNFKNSVHAWLHYSSFINQKLEAKEISLSGIIFDRKNKLFTTIQYI